MGDELLFVYGTLRPAALSRAPAHIAEAVQKHARPVSAGSVAGALHWVSWYPALVEGSASRVRGDLLALDATLLGKLDGYEGDEYERRRVRVQLEAGDETEAWAYIFLNTNRLGARIESGDFLTEPPHETASIDYLHLKPDQALPERANSTRFKSIVVADSDTTQEWRACVSDWLVRAGCLYAVIWGRECSTWHEDIDWASVNMFEHDAPEDHLVMTTSHEDESLEDAMWFAAFSAFHPSVDLEQTLIIDISPTERRSEMLDRYQSALKS